MTVDYIEIVTNFGVYYKWEMNMTNTHTLEYLVGPEAAAEIKKARASRRPDFVFDLLISPFINVREGLTSLLRTIGNASIVLILMILVVIPLSFVLTGNHFLYQLTAALWIPTILIVFSYAPWYGLITFIPALIVWGMNACSSTMFALVILLWSLYGLIRGITHNIQWEAESRRGEAHHPVLNHPYAFLGTFVGVELGIWAFEKFNHKR